MLSEAVREVEQIEPTNGELEGKLEEAPVLRENEGFSQGLNLADISIKEIKRNILEVYKEYFSEKKKVEDYWSHRMIAVPIQQRN